MATQSDDDHEQLRRFSVALFIVHPTISPAEVSAALGLEGHYVHPVGEPRRGGRGQPLRGVYRDTRWRHVVRYESSDQHFAEEFEAFVERLLPHRTFLKGLRASGGEAQIIFASLGDGYLGDAIPLATLAKITDLGLDFGIECFLVPQN